MNLNGSRCINIYCIYLSHRIDYYSNFLHSQYPNVKFNVNFIVMNMLYLLYVLIFRDKDSYTDEIIYLFNKSTYITLCIYIIIIISLCFF